MSPFIHRAALACAALAAGIPLAQATPSPVLSAPSSLSFGDVLVGTTGNVLLTVTNIGQTGSSLSGLFGAANGDPAIGPATTLPFGPLAKNHSAGRTYSYTPLGRGPDSATVALPQGHAVHLSGLGVAPQNAITTTPFGSVRVGTTGSGSLTVTNAGDGNLSGLGAVSNLHGTAGSLGAPWGGGGGTINLTDGGHTTFGYTFSPTQRGPVTAHVPVNFSNGSGDGANNSQNMLIALSGTGVGPAYNSLVAPDGILDFGTLSRGQLGQLTLDIWNDTSDSGAASLVGLTLRTYTIGGTDPGNFSLGSFTPGQVLMPGVHQSLTAGFSAASAGVYDALLTIGTDQGAALGHAGDSFAYELTADVTVPEPPALPLLGGGLAGLMAAWRRRKDRRCGSR